MNNANEIVTTSGMTGAELMAAMGMATGPAEQQNTRLPLLKVNYSDEDDDGNTLKKGTMALTLSSGTVYGKDVRVRVYADFLQYLNFDAEVEAVVNKTIIHRPGDEPIDEQGTLRCGKPTSKELRDMPDDIKKAYQSITCFRYLYCTVTMADAKTGAGDPVDVTEVPALFRMKGQSFLAFNKVQEACRSLSIQPVQVEATVTTERHKKGSVVYFVLGMEADMSTKREVTSQDFELMSSILESVKAENGPIKAKYNEALRAKQADASDEDLVGEVESYLDSDFEE